MSRLLDIQDKLQDTNAAIGKLEQALVANRSSEALILQAESLRTRQKKLENQFLSIADQLGVDVCTYRLIAETPQTTISALSTALQKFQSMFSLVYDAIKNGPKETGKIKAEIAALTSFRFAYAFSGSMGIVLTIDRELLLMEDLDTDIDKSINEVFDLAKSKTPADVLKHKDKLGIPPIRRVYAWADSLAAAGLGADIQWRRGQSIRSSLFIQVPELEALRTTIAKTSEETVEEFSTRGELFGANLRTRRFEMKLEDGQIIKGTFTDAISEAHEATIPHYYNAVFRVIKKRKYSTDEDDISYFLVKLDGVKKNVS